MALSTTGQLTPYNIQNMEPYVAGKTIAEVKRKYNPPRISKLASNENRIGYSSVVKQAILKKMPEIHDYPDPAAHDLREKLAQLNNVKPENIIVAAGSESIIAILCRTFFLNNEAAVTANATFVGFFVHTSVRGISVKKIPLTANYRFDLPAMAQAVDDRVKMIYIANPNNPTGTYVTRSEIERFIRQIPEDVIVVMDEAYYEFARDVPDYPNALDLSHSNIIALRTFSKAYGLAGMRIGYGIASEEIISHMMKTKLAFEPTVLAQTAAHAALDDQEFVARTKSVVEEGRNRLYRFFEEHNVSYVPSVANSILVRFGSVNQAAEFTEQMLENGVILRQTNAFGLPDCVRITIGKKKEMDHFTQVFDQLEITDKL